MDKLVMRIEMDKFIESSTRCVEPDHVIDVGFSVLDGIIIAVMTPPGPAPRITKGEYSAKIFTQKMGVFSRKPLEK